MMNDTTFDAGVTRIADAVMRGFAGALNYRIADVDLAVDVMRAETKALFADARYEDARAAILNRAINEQYVIGLVVASAVASYRAKGGR